MTADNDLTTQFYRERASSFWAPEPGWVDPMIAEFAENVGKDRADMLLKGLLAAQYFIAESDDPVMPPEVRVRLLEYMTSLPCFDLRLHPGEQSIRPDADADLEAAYGPVLASIWKAYSELGANSSSSRTYEPR